MAPKSWPKRLTYARESVSVDVVLSFLRHCLHTGNPEDLHRNSWVIENKCAHPHLQIKKIVPSLKIADQRPHPLACQKTCAGHPNYGIFATDKINIGTEIGEYVGEISIISPEKYMQIKSSKAFSSEYLWVVTVNNLILEIDAQDIANELALVNDYRGLRAAPNMTMTVIIHKGFFYFGYVAICDIQKGEELLVDYGEIFHDILTRASAPKKN